MRLVVLNWLLDKSTFKAQHCWICGTFGWMDVQVLEAHEDEVWFLQFSHDGHHLASTSKDCTAIIWEVS